MIFIAHPARFVNEIFRHLRTIRRGLIFSVTYDTIYTLTANGGGKYVADNKARAGTVAQKSSSQKPLTKITINDIAEDCGINRMTFYYHFKDIYDLVEWSCMEDARKALEEKKTYDTWQQGLLQIFDAVRQNKPFIMNVYRCVHQEQVEKFLSPLVDSLLRGVINEESAGMTVRDEDKDFIAQVYSYVFIGIMLDWIKNDMRGEPEVIVEKLATLIKGSISSALGRFKV